MAWSVTVNDIGSYEGFDLEIQEGLASQHPSYPRDADMALRLARDLGLGSATLAGSRTPSPDGGPDVVDVAVHGMPGVSSFLDEMKRIIASGPGEGSPAAMHYAALARLREKPCPHEFAYLYPDDPVNAVMHCSMCHVYYEGGRLWFSDM